MIQDIIEDMLANHTGNKDTLDDPDAAVSNYRHGYYDGYHDALVDLLNMLHIPHKHEIINQ